MRSRTIRGAAAPARNRSAHVGRSGRLAVEKRRDDDPAAARAHRADSAPRAQRARAGRRRQSRRRGERDRLEQVRRGGCRRRGDAGPAFPARRAARDLRRLAEPPGENGVEERADRARRVDRAELDLSPASGARRARAAAAPPRRRRTQRRGTASSGWSRPRRRRRRCSARQRRSPRRSRAQSRSRISTCACVRRPPYPGHRRRAGTTPPYGRQLPDRPVQRGSIHAAAAASAPASADLRTTSTSLRPRRSSGTTRAARRVTRAHLLEDADDTALGRPVGAPPATDRRPAGAPPRSSRTSPPSRPAARAGRRRSRSRIPARRRSGSPAAGCPRGAAPSARRSRGRAVNRARSRSATSGCSTCGDAERGGDRLARDVVGRAAEPAGDDTTSAAAACSRTNAAICRSRPGSPRSARPRARAPRAAGRASCRSCSRRHRRRARCRS